ncbi:MAG: hypothetical protein K2J98_01590 [Malacoplasma sp.]|nr:hypothetical protein [Malacoplasma sp.]
MGKFKKINFLKFSLLSGVTALSLGAIFSNLKLNDSISLVNTTNHASSATDVIAASGTDDSFTKFTKNENTDTSSGISIYPFDFDYNSSNSTYDFNKVSEDQIIQNTANDDSGNTGYASFVKYNNNVAVAKFLSSNVYTTTTTDGTSTTSTKYAGTVDWVVTKDDLIKLAYKGEKNSDLSNTSGYTLNFKAMLFSSGGNTAPKSLFVIASISNTGDTSINGSYLFQINWSTINDDDSLSNSINGDKNAGSYRLAAVLSKTTSSSGTTNNFIDYNFLAMEAVSTNTMQAIYLPKRDTSNSSNYKGKYVTVSNSLFGTTTTRNAVDITFQNESSYFATNQSYIPVYVNRVNSRFFFIFQLTSGTQANNALVFVRSEELTDNANVSITISGTNNFKTLNFNNYTSANMVKTNVYYNQNASTSRADFNMIISSPGSDRYIWSQFDFISFNFTNSPTSTLYSWFPTGGFITQVVPYYSLNSYDVSGYYALTSANRVISLKTDFSFDKLIYDFNSSVFQLGNIYKIYTIPGDASGVWFAQMNDGTFAKMNYSNLVGQWDKLEQNSSYEKEADFIIKSQDEVDSSVFFRKVVNNGANAFDGAFTDFISGNTVWKNFLDFDESSIDGQLPAGTEPNVSVSIYKQNDNNYYFGSSATHKLEDNKSNTLTLVFTQNLRKINAGGSLDYSDTKSVIIGSYTYTFYYGEAKINNNSKGSTNYDSYDVYKNLTGLTIPEYVLEMYPSKIASLINGTDADSENNANFINSFLKMENIVSPIVTASGNDINGTLTINVSVPYIWDVGNIVTPGANWVFTFGSNTEPFFKYNPFGFTDATNYVSNASVTPVDESFAKLTENDEKMNSLISKYSTMLASEVSKESYYNDFLVLGSAFALSSNISSNLITLPTSDTEANITVIPDDVNGNAFVSINFPKIGPDENYTVSFTTPNIFLKDPSASQSVYFTWKSSKQVSDTITLSNYKASNIANSLESSSYTDQLAMLDNFAVYSDYYANLIVNGKLKISTSYDDKQGFLMITLTPLEGLEIPGVDTEIVMSYNSFQIDANGLSNVDTNDTNKFTSNFSFKTYSASNTKSPSSITINDLISGGLLDSNFQNWLDNDLATISLVPSNLTGTLKVSVTLKNYSENNTITPLKTFTTNIGGFATSSQSANMLLWKTNDDEVLKQKLPSTIVETATNTATANAGNQINRMNFEKLLYFAYVSDDLKAKLDANPTMVSALTVQPDDKSGSLIITAVIVENGISTVYTNTLTGLGTSASLQPVITFNVDDASGNNAILNSLRELNPSKISIENSQLSQLFTISDSSPNYITSVDLSYDDFGGTLTINIVVKDADGVELARNSRTYTGFSTIKDTSKGTNWGIVAASIIVPLVVLLVPVLLIGQIQQRRNMKAIAKRLSSRLKEEQDREKRLRKHQLQMSQKNR